MYSGRVQSDVCFVHEAKPFIYWQEEKKNKNCAGLPEGMERDSLENIDHVEFFSRRRRK